MRQYPGHTPVARDGVYNTMCSAVYGSASVGGVAAGALFWQLLEQGMDNFRYGYEIILNQDTSVANIISNQSQKLSTL
ncbi:hypothetical protein Ancab_028927 [Ancistrocladus abbreviatus]